MRTWLANRMPLGTPAAAEGSADRKLGLLDWIREILVICRRGRTAAQYYEELRPQSDQSLAAKGLKRSDLPRAAFEKLTNES